MMLPSTDFESVASTSFATEASSDSLHYTYFHLNVKKKIRHPSNFRFSFGDSGSLPQGKSPLPPTAGSSGAGIGQIFPTARLFLFNPLLGPHDQTLGVFYSRQCFYFISPFPGFFVALFIELEGVFGT